MCKSVHSTNESGITDVGVCDKGSFSGGKCMPPRKTTISHKVSTKTCLNSKEVSAGTKKDLRDLIVTLHKYARNHTFIDNSLFVQP